MKIGVVGLGAMGGPIAARLLLCGSVYVYDTSVDVRVDFVKKYSEVRFVDSLEKLVASVDVIWLMIPAHAVEIVFQELIKYAKKPLVIIDGGNSYFKDSMRRYQLAKQKGHQFLDCGASGGLEGAQHGFCLMVGGDDDAYIRASDIFKVLAHDEYAYAHVGPAGAGHYVKMVHNGIEYGLMQAYADGFNLLHNGAFPDLDLEQISALWMHGAVVRSWLLSLIVEIFKHDKKLLTIGGEVEETGMGAWTVEEAREKNIPLPVIEKALEVRRESRMMGGNYGTRLVALMRNKMGGHTFRKKGG